MSLDLNVAKQRIALNVLTHSIRKTDISTSEISMTLPGQEIKIFKFPDIVKSLNGQISTQGQSLLLK